MPRIRRAWSDGDLLPGFRDRFISHVDATAGMPGTAASGFDPARSGLAIARQHLRAVTHTAMAFLLTEDERYLRSAEAWLMSAARLEDWDVRHFLSAAEMTAAAALGLRWLEPHLQESTRDEITDAIISRALRPSFTLATDGPRDIEAGTWPLRGDNNWSQVCHGGLVLGALAVRGREPALARSVIDRAVEHLPHTMQTVYGPRGSYAEGPMYWGYGTTFNVLLIAGLRSELGHSFGLESVGGFSRTADYQLHLTGNTGRYFNYADCREDATFDPAMFWFAHERNDPSLLYHEVRNMRACLDEPGSARTRALLSHRLLPLVFLWSPALAEVTPPKEKDWCGDGISPVVTHRSGWDQEDVYLALKGGTPASSHGHMDIGSFVLEARGVRWAVDLGLQDYGSLERSGLDIWDREQDSDRWRVFRYNNLSHNTLVIDGALQRVRADAYVSVFGGTAEPCPHSRLDMSEVYADQLEAAHRSVALVDGQAVVVRDELVAARKPARVRWAMVTHARIDRCTGNKAVLRQDGKTMYVVLLSPTQVTWEACSAAPPAAHDAANEGALMLCCHSDLPPGEPRVITVAFLPVDYETAADVLTQRCETVLATI